jgi:hypothetical protein
MTNKLKRLATSVSVIIVTAFLIRLTYAWFDSLGRPIPEEFSWETGRIARSIALAKGFANLYPGVETGPTAILSGLSGLFLLCRQQREISLPIAIVPLVYPMIY